MLCAPISRAARALSMADCDWDIDAAIAFEESLLYSENGPPAELAGNIRIANFTESIDTEM